MPEAEDKEFECGMYINIQLLCKVKSHVYQLRKRVREYTSNAQHHPFHPPKPQLYTLSNYLSSSHTVAVAVVTTFPLTEYPSTLLLSFLLSLTAALQELHLPYLGRQLPPLSRRDELALLVRENPQQIAALAFVLPFTLALMVPILGPLTIILAHAAAPVALVELVLPGRTKGEGGGEGKGKEGKEEVEEKKKVK